MEISMHRQASRDPPVESYDQLAVTSFLLQTSDSLMSMFYRNPLRPHP